MRNCDNCNHGSYGLDCNSGVETLYCREGEYEHEVMPTDVCSTHQFIDGYENELQKIDCSLQESTGFVKTFKK